MEAVGAAAGTGQAEKQQRKGLSGSTLKLVAVITMLIDHVAAAVLMRVLIDRGLYSAVYPYDTFREKYYGMILAVYLICRYIGRIAFPIFCFLLVEGFTRTHDVKKYVIRMAVFALVTEIPFDLAFAGRPFYWGYQNVMFTLLIGLLVMWGMSAVEKKGFAAWLTWLCNLLVAAAGAVLASLMETDYGAIGVVCIVVLYVFRRKKPLQIAAGCVAFLWEITAPLAFIFIGFYNGKRGWRMKYLFYAFYPVHLFLLYLISAAMGLGDISTL